MPNKKLKDDIEKTHKASEAVASSVVPGFGAIKTIGDTHAKVTDKKNILSTHSMDIAIFLGFIWSVGKIVEFYYPNGSWSNWSKIFDTFMPMVIIILALLCRLYPYVKSFFK